MPYREVSNGNMLDDPSDLLVIAVNTIPRIMGKGQAKSFADRWPILKELQGLACQDRSLVVGRGKIVTAEGRNFFLFPTKKHWQNPAQLQWIDQGLKHLAWTVNQARLNDWPIGSIAMPALGCGLGGLAWQDVRPLIVQASERTPETSWRVYCPGAEKIPVDNEEIPF